jgi:2-polyprenyl-3-methyl-5-hydroxy-6-metoxy-1,4-benzoquinol methylase
MAAPFYRMDFAVDDRDPLQQTLNRLYRYESDTVTKVLHRSRLNLFYLLMQDLLERGFLPRLDSALDVGCNAGAYARMLADLGFRSVAGIDIDEEAIARARAEFTRGNGNIEFRVEDAERMTTEGEFDLVLCTEVVEHTSNPEQVVANIERALTPGGIAVVSLPNGFSFPYLVTRVIHLLRRRRKDPDLRAHLRYPSYRSTRLFGDAMEVIAIEGTNLFFDPVTLRLVYRTPVFPAVNRVNFFLARTNPLKYLAQFVFLAARKRVA